MDELVFLGTTETKARIVEGTSKETHIKTKINNKEPD
jgi:hypothetical protein